MKQLFTCIVCLFIVQISNAQTDRKTANDSARLSGEWFLQPVLPSDTATGHVPSLNFDLARKTFTGFTGCNRMTGGFRVNGDAIVFDKDIAVTKIACEGFNEKEFVTNLLRVDHYKFMDGFLVLLIDKTPVSKWMRRTDKIITTE